MQPSGNLNHGKYFIEVVSKALDVLEVLGVKGSELTLTEISKRVGLSRSSTFRLLYTLEQRRWVERANGGKKYRRLSGRRQWRIGYAMLSSQFPYCTDVSRSLQEAAQQYGVELLVTDNCFSAEIALMNVQMFIKQGVDFVIECQVRERVAPIIAHQLAQAGIPSLAIDIPQPGAVFFGANNYQAGLMAGHALGQHAASVWGSKADKILLLEATQAGPIPQARLTGALHGIQEVLGPVHDTGVVHIDCRGTLRDAFAMVGSALKSFSPGCRLLIAAVNDATAIGAVRALEEAGRTSEAAVVGQGATLEARLEMRRPDSCLLGSVGYFPEKYGSQILPLIIKILDGQAVPPAVYVEHVLISPSNIDAYYPGDVTMDSTAERNVEKELIDASAVSAPPVLI